MQNPIGCGLAAGPKALAATQPGADNGVEGSGPEAAMVTIQVLGTGCPRCAALYENARRAAREAHIEARVEKVTDIARIMDLGVLLTPALVIDGVVRASGKVLTADEIRAMLEGT